MKNILIALTVLLSFGVGYAIAQSTAIPIQIGVLTSTGCTGSISPCWQPNSANNPFYFTSN